ncbi:hypothetical protein [Solirubrobacter soli]|uniref:hypothetical protein n=1 Tax=Solirubrobacter soli TaxID=363832 RepID=UPI00041B90F6|nr:hypothetical protein [Solirubrobacter soli]
MGDKVFITEADLYAWNKVTSRTLPADGPQPTLYILGDFPPPAPIPPTWTGAATPAVVQRPDGETVVVAIAPDGSLSTYSNTAGTRTWMGTILAGAGNAGYAPSAALLPGGELRIATTGFTGSVLVRSQAGPAAGWTESPVTGKNAGRHRGPVLVTRDSGKSDAAGRRDRRGCDRPRREADDVRRHRRHHDLGRAADQAVKSAKRLVGIER